MPKKKDIPDLDAHECIEVLRTMYKPPAHAFFEQVANGTGWKAKGWIDALVMGIWPSRGLDLQGFEVKVSRADWKKELDNPAKAENIQRYCDYWWIVTPRGLIDPAQLPKTWGLIEITEKKTGVYTVPAPKLTPEPMTRHFLAAILRRQFDLWEDAKRGARREGREEGARDGAGDLARQLEMYKNMSEASEKTIKTFEEASGIEIAGWRGPKLMGEALKLILDSRHRLSTIERLRRECSSLRTTAEAMDQEIAALEKLGPSPASELLQDDGLSD